MSCQPFPIYELTRPAQDCGSGWSWLNFGYDLQEKLDPDSTLEKKPNANLTSYSSLLFFSLDIQVIIIKILVLYFNFLWYGSEKLIQIRNPGLLAAVVYVSSAEKYHLSSQNLPYLIFTDIFFMFPLSILTISWSHKDPTDQFVRPSFDLDARSTNPYSICISARCVDRYWCNQSMVLREAAKKTGLILVLK